MPRSLAEIPSSSEDDRRSTGFSEFDRVLGGGIVAGSVVLVGGAPGIGKSTLLLQAAGHLSKSQNSVVYVSGEESAAQIKLRAARLGLAYCALQLLNETDVTAITAIAQAHGPSALVVDSIQTTIHPDIDSAPGSVSSVRACTAELARMAKEYAVPVFIVGHVTKEGSLAGPRVLEHMVDTVLTFEGDRHYVYRLLRATKNRFGSTDEIGLFEMHEHGLAEVTNPSEALLAERTHGVAGSAITATIEGSRPLLAEVQALVAQSYLSSPRRTVSGVDLNRVNLILAVLEKRVGLRLGDKDVFVNVAGGIRLDEPATDLAIACAIASSYHDAPVDPECVLAGEIGLGGEIRAVSQAEKRLREAARLGFRRALVSSSNHRSLRGDAGAMAITGVDNLQAALSAVLDR